MSNGAWEVDDVSFADCPGLFRFRISPTKGASSILTVEEKQPGGANGKRRCSAAYSKCNGNVICYLSTWL